MRSREELQAHYEKLVGKYAAYNYEPGVQGWVMHQSHVLLESSLPDVGRIGTLVEVGIGTGNHLPHVRHEYDRYIGVDRDPAFLDRARANLPDRPAAKHEFRKGDACSVPVEDGTADRLIAAHLWEHIPEPEKALAEWMRVLRVGGTLSLLLPCDPGFAWRLGRHLGPRFRWTKIGVPYDYIMAIEHVNPIGNLVAIVRHHFEERSEAWWPLRLPIYDANLFWAVHVKKPAD